MNFPIALKKDALLCMMRCFKLDSENSAQNINLAEILKYFWRVLFSYKLWVLVNMLCIRIYVHI
jgi:hypothetical protein